MILCGAKTEGVKGGVACVPARLTEGVRRHDARLETPCVEYRVGVVDAGKLPAQTLIEMNS